jgi:transmembrane sensor
LDEIFEKIELYYNVHITILNKGVLRNHYSGKFRVRDGVEHIIRVMQIVNKFEYTITDDRTNIIIK